MGYEYSKGCDLCRQRKVKCDETKPGCLRCRQYNVQCPGYSARPLRFLIAAAGQQQVSSPSKKRTSGLSEEQSTPSPVSIQQSSPALFGNQPDSQVVAPRTQDEPDLLRLLMNRIDSALAGQPVLSHFLLRIASSGALSQQCALLLPAAMLSSFTRKTQDPALTHINRCLNSIRARLELRSAQFDSELLISIASMAQLDNLVLLYTQSFYNPLENVARHWQASVALIQHDGISALPPEAVDQVVFLNWTDCTMIVPQLHSDYQKFDPHGSPQSESQRCQCEGVQRDLSLLYRILEPGQSNFEDIQAWSFFDATQLTNLRQALKRLHGIFARRLSGKIQDMTHIMVYGSLAILIYIHCMLLLNTTNQARNDFWLHLVSILADVEEQDTNYMCFLCLRIFLTASDGSISAASLKGKEKQDDSSQHILWTISRAVRVAKLLSEPLLRRVIDTLLFNLLRISNTARSDSTIPVLTEDDLRQDIIRKTAPIHFLRSLSQDCCPFGEIHDWAKPDRR